MKLLSIVVPVYFNAGSLPLLHERLAALETKLRAMDLQMELIFVDDGSGDNSHEELLRIKAARPATKVIKLTRNFGAISASKCGLQYVTGDCFTILAADLQEPPELILQMAEHWLAGSKFTICQRTSREDPPSTRLFARIFYWLVHRLVMKQYPEGGYDLALMDKAMLPHLLKGSKNLYTPLLTYWLGYRPVVIHYHRERREHGTSKWTFAKKFKAFLDVILGFSVTPIRLMSLIGVLVAGASFGYGVLVVVGAFLGNIPVPGFASIVALITFLLGIVIMMLGVIGEYLWRVFDELNKRPEWVIDEIR